MLKLTAHPRVQISLRVPKPDCGKFPERQVVCYRPMPCLPTRIAWLHEAYTIQTISRQVDNTPTLQLFDRSSMSHKAGVAKQKRDPGVVNKDRACTPSV